MNVEGCLRSVRCPECKTVFYPTAQWGWKVGGRQYCRYNCMRAAQKNMLKRKANRLNKERIRMVQRRAPAEEINLITWEYTDIIAAVK